MKLIHQWEGGLHKHDTHTHILGFYSSIEDAGQVLERQAYAIRNTHGAKPQTNQRAINSSLNKHRSGLIERDDMTFQSRAKHLFSSLWARKSEVNNVR